MIFYPDFGSDCYDDGETEEPNDFNGDMFSELNNALLGDELFGRINTVLDKAAQEAWFLLRRTYAELKDDELARMVLFYCVVFSLKLGLLIALKKGSAYGYDFRQGDYDV